MNKIQKFWRLIAIAAIMASALNLGLMPATPVQALSADIVISQVYGGGGNSGAAYKNDYIELFNRGTTSVSLTGKSVQYASATGSTWQVTPLSGTLAAGQYYLVQQAAGGGGTTALPTPDATGTIPMSGSKGKVALVDSTTALSEACPTTGVIDFFGFGAANCSEAAPTAELSNTTAAKRNVNGCTETDSNVADFTVADPTVNPTPRNSASPIHLCTPPLPSLSIDDVSVTEGDAGPTTASFSVTLSEEAPAGGVTFDIATSDGTATIADNDYDANSAISASIAGGATTYSFDVTVNGDTDIEVDETFNVTISNPSSNATIGDGAGVGTITNDDFPALSLSVNDVSQAEGNSGDTTFTFTATLSTPAPVGGVSFDVATADGTATLADADYVQIPSTPLTIAETETSKTFDVIVKGDTNVEVDETFSVTLSNATNGATIVNGQGLGTILNDDLGLSINDVTVLEGNSATTTASFTVTLTGTSTSAVTFDIATADNTATVTDNDYLAKSVTPATIAAESTTYTFDVTVNGDLAIEANETFYVNLSNASGATIVEGQGLGSITNDDAAATDICAIQGSAASTPLSGVHTIEGVVIGDFEGSAPNLNGFYVQQENCDGDPTTSDGIFVYKPATNLVALGDLVRVTGTVGENPILPAKGQTQISATSIVVLGSGYSVAPTEISLPFTSEAQKEQYEGMLVHFTQPLTVTEHYLLGRFGQVTLSNGKLWQPTGVALPGAPAAVIQASNDLNKIILDDSSNIQNSDPIVFGRGGQPLSASNTLRGGDTVANLSGVLIENWGGNSSSPTAYRILPINAMGGGIPNFVAVNERPATPPVVGGTLNVAGMNLLNYFNTFTDCSNGLGGTPNTSNCRGADDAVEFTRQSAKTVAAIVGMDADVIGIVEIENDGYGSQSAIQDLVNRLNAATAPGTYAFVDVDAQTNLTNAMGVDGIKNGLIYKPAKVSMVGDTAVLDTEAFVNGGDSAARNRVSLLQAFQETASGETFLVNVNHLKSKGSACNDPDTGDGQGNCAIVRTNAALKLADWLNLDDPTGTGDPDIIILGDLNSYAMEAPIVALEGKGYTDLGNYFNGVGNYSYVFDGQWGYLDYAMASNSLLGQVANTQTWHINADEPIVLDYNTEYKTAGQLISLYAPDQYRISDHDPVMVGLNLDRSKPTVVSITRADTNPTSAASVAFTVSFSEDVKNVTAADFELNITGSLAGAAVTTVTPVSASVYTVTVSTGTGSGTLRLDLPVTSDIEDLAGNPLAGLPYITGPVYQVRSQIFFDVPVTYWAWSFIERLYNAGITGGCATTPNLLYCPDETVTRAQMAVFLLKSMHGPAFAPPLVGDSTGFDDVDTGYWAAAWIKQLAAEGITGGCGVGLYCPEAPVTRAQMAVFLLKAKNGSGYLPPAIGDGSGFTDVADDYWAAVWIKQLAADGITGGCGPGLYCPENSVTRAQMAVFIVKTFGLP